MTQDTDLDDLFAQAQADRPQPSADLFARIMADATTQMPIAAMPIAAAARPAAARRGAWSAMLAWVGGSGALAGVTTAVVAGVWLGFAQPGPVLALSEGVRSLSEGVLGEDTLDQVELFASFDDIFTEG